MQANWVAITEISLILVGALAWGVYEMLSLRRYRRRLALENAEPSRDADRDRSA